MLPYRRSVGETEGKERKEGERRESESAKDSDAVRLHHVVSRKEMYDAHFVELSRAYPRKFSILRIAS